MVGNKYSKTLTVTLTHYLIRICPFLKVSDLLARYLQIKERESTQKILKLDSSETLFKANFKPTKVPQNV